MSFKRLLSSSGGRQNRLFLAITIIVVIIVIIVAPNTATAIALVLAIVALAIAICHSKDGKRGGADRETMVSGPTCRLSQTGFDTELLGCSAGPKGSKSFCPNAAPPGGAPLESAPGLGPTSEEPSEGKKEGFLGNGGYLPGPRAPYAVAAPEITANGVDENGWEGGDIVLHSPRGYPGGFESMEDFSTDSTGGPTFYGPVVDSADNSSFADMGSDTEMSSIDPGADDAWALGHRDRLEEDYDVEPDGNPFDLARTAAPLAAGPCVDDEANNDELDGDEGMSLQGLSRNDATRVEAGIFNRRRDMDKYFREELQESENKYWYGAHEV
jgi:hypothetical protein